MGNPGGVVKSSKVNIREKKQYVPPGKQTLDAAGMDDELDETMAVIDDHKSGFLEDLLNEVDCLEGETRSQVSNECEGGSSGASTEKSGSSADKKVW